MRTIVLNWSLSEESGLKFTWIVVVQWLVCSRTIRASWPTFCAWEERKSASAKMISRAIRLSERAPKHPSIKGQEEHSLRMTSEVDLSVSRALLADQDKGIMRHGWRFLIEEGSLDRSTLLCSYLVRPYDQRSFTTKSLTNSLGIQWLRWLTKTWLITCSHVGGLLYHQQLMFLFPSQNLSTT